MTTNADNTYQHSLVQLLAFPVPLFPKQVSPDDVKVMDTVIFDVNKDGNAMEQKLWPRHCVQNSWGAELHQDLKVGSSWDTLG